MKDTRTAEQKRYHARVRELRCCLTGHDATIHHVHGGSMAPLIKPGMGQKANHWLVIPLAPEYHSAGPWAIDGGYGVLSWEREFGTQLFWLAHVADRLNVDVFHLAGIERPAHIVKYPEEA